MSRGVARRLIRPAIAVIVIAGLVLFVGRVNWGQTWQAIRAASPTLLAAAAVINLLSLALKAVRWWVFLRASGMPSLRLALRATFAGAALNNILVANAGEAARVVLVSRSAGIASEKVLATLALERLFEFAGYVAMFLVAVSLIRLPEPLRDLRAIAFITAAALLGGLAYLTLHRSRGDEPVRTRARLMDRVAAYGRRFASALTGVSTARRFGAAMAISVVVWALQIATYQLTARAAHFPLPLSGTVAAILAVNLGFAVRATPGNVGVFQAIYAMTASAFGMDADVAVGVALLIQAQQILPVTVIGLLAAPEAVRVPVRG